MIHAVDLLEFSPLSLEQQHHHYYLDLLKKDSKWHGTVLAKRKNFTTPQNIRNLRDIFPFILNGGWHFSYMGGIERVILKHLSIVEGYERVQDGRISVEKKHVEEAMRAGVYLDDNLNEYDKIPASRKSVPYDISNIKLPYFAEFVKKYPNFLRPKD